MFQCKPTNLYQYSFVKSKMVGAIVFSVFLLFVFSFPFFFFLFLFSFFLFFFFLTWSLADKKTLTKSINLNFLAKLKAENQRVHLNLKTLGTNFDSLYQHTCLYQHTYYASINIKT